MNEPICILATLDKNYIPYFNVMLSSLLDKNEGETFRVFLMNSSIAQDDLRLSQRLLCGRGELVSVKIAEDEFDGAPTSDRYPKEMYYRIFASKYLPGDVDRVLYLDPDIVVNGSIRELYDMPMGENYFAAATHIRAFLKKFNELRLDMDDDSPYINSGVMLMNLGLLRREQDTDEVYRYIEEHKGKLFLPDQDIISGLYGEKIMPLDPVKYNMTEKLYAQYLLHGKMTEVDDVRRESVIIHFCGRNKPWKENYMGALDVFYNEAKAALDEKIK